ncbi:hypothetical protein NLX86_12135 [Streptomyces sp. A3M-1-3]|uniref:COG4315 family predicted lipoprotein n=1 Tax=Streptomyces sp. A3M-1-3 TaxID=2962044 RepID=UPI0020B81415|nr:hypothetical protein [Streptomyces sp. A3M-1-3]MCP3818831.1 hypothetical protein [Streptomyces sp. A3M-1-3]
MKRTAQSTVMAAAMALFTAVTCGCGNGGEAPTPRVAETTAARTASPTATAPEAAATVTARSSALGQILVDGTGRTLYLFEADTSEESTCTGTCAAAWPPLTTTGEPKAAEGAKEDLLGTAIRDDGSTAVTYNGHPLYYYQGDRKPGDMNGQDLLQFGAKWYVLNVAGNKIEGEGGGGGY